MSLVTIVSFLLYFYHTNNAALQSSTDGFNRFKKLSKGTKRSYFNLETKPLEIIHQRLPVGLHLSSELIVDSPGAMFSKEYSAQNCLLESSVPPFAPDAKHIHRRRLIFSSLVNVPFLLSGSECLAVQRAVGSAEQACREAGNCLEKMELDGFIGWNWGGKDRCDPYDVRCGVDGTLRPSANTAKAVPLSINDEGIPLKITDIINLQLSIGKREFVILRIGLYGQSCPKSVQQLLAFCADDGLITSERLMNQNGFDIITAPIRLGSSGILSMIYPERHIEFGILSQSKAYAKAKRLSKAGDSFVAQPRPTNSDQIGKEKSARSHKVAGLVSIPKNGLGYAGNLLAVDDEAFSESFGIIAMGDETLNQSRKVIGQLIDEESMVFLSRLSSLATVKGLKGFVPGFTNGPPLIPVVIRDISIQSNVAM